MFKSHTLLRMLDVAYLSESTEHDKEKVGVEVHAVFYQVTALLAELHDVHAFNYEVVFLVQFVDA